MTYVTGIHSRFLNNRMMNCSKGMLADQAKKKSAVTAKGLRPPRKNPFEPLGLSANLR